MGSEFNMYKRNQKGQFVKGNVMPEEIRKKISKTMKGMTANNKGIPHSLETRKKISEKLRGENAPSWKGGITPINQAIRDSFDYKEWKRSVLERDNYTCQICGQTNGELRANHIKKFSDYPELRLVNNNGITICTKCDTKLVMYHEKEWESYFNFNLETRYL